MDDYITGCSRVDLRSLESRTNTAIHSLDDLLNALDVEFARALNSGVVALKVGLAYERSLHFEKTTKADAERIFNRLDQFFVPLAAESQQPPVSWNEAKPLQDYLMHQVIRRGIEHSLPIQIHTGLQEGNGNYLPNANPMHLVNLFIEYPEAKFVLFHAGYPYRGEMTVLGKNFANVYLDLCWVHIISPWVARQTLHEWIETVPANKIFAFGGDYLFVEGVYAHSRIARANVAEVLSQKVEHGYLSEDEALDLGRKFLRENALQFYKLDS